MNKFFWLLSLVVLLVAVVLPMAAARGADMTVAQLRAAFQAGNVKDAYDGLSAKVLTAEGTDQLVDDFNLCLQALNRLGRTEEIDAFREKAVAAHAGDWQFLFGVAQSYLQQPHYGVIIAGAYRRGNNRNGDGKWVSSLERDRVRALQLMQQAAAVLQKEKSPEVAMAARFYFGWAQLWMLGESGREAWRLQALTDVNVLPDYEEQAQRYYGRYGQVVRGAPVDEKGDPILHQLPKGGLEGAKTDGERMRWALLQASELSPTEAVHARLTWAQFLESQFGVETMAGYGVAIGREDGKTNESGPFAVSTLKDEETIARLANGIRRFALADEFNPVKQFQAIAAGDKAVGPTYVGQAMDALAGIYENRQQYVTAAEWWNKGIKAYGPGPGANREHRLEQIEGNWGTIENGVVQPAGGPGGAGATVDFRFRNATKVTFTATEIDVATLLSDVKAYIKGNPQTLDWNVVQVSNVGYRLVEKNEVKYLKRATATTWEMALVPREKHFDKRVAVQTPVKKGGAYLLSGQVEGGNIARCIVWVADAVIVSKPLNGQALTYVADAVTGKAIAGATVEYFGYRQVNLRDRVFRVDTQEYAAKTTGTGEVIVDVNEAYNERPLPAINAARPVFAAGLNWLTVATTADGRLAFEGFEGMWGNRISGDDYDNVYNQVKAFVMTDRPVYRPEQTVQFKVWVGNNKYDQEGKNPHAGEHVNVEVRNPQGEVIKTVSGALDAWGGIAGEMALTKSATLGVYSINVPLPNGGGGASFRVEEYKKPEFEVKVDAPTEPVMLGEKITATVAAKYYFGSPVTNAVIKTKVTRTTHSAQWYPAGRWDWFYEPGYWWFAHDYVWYPGFARWGTFAPVRSWWPGRWANEQPEVISENETAVGPDGTVKVEIDTAVAKAIYGDRDHKYTISAEVTDASRRTITGTGDVLVARDPFKVYVWTDRGYYRVGDTLRASMSAQTLDNKPVEGKGAMKLLRVSYDAAGKPTETEVQTWAVDTKVDGHAEQQIKADKIGQYRLSYTVADAHNHVIEGGYVFVVRGPDDKAFEGRDFKFNDVEITTDKKEYAAGEKVKLLVSTEKEGATVLLFVRPSNGVYLPPKVIEMQGKSVVEEVDVGKKDMPNFFVEALTISNARVHTDVREVIVPPEDRVLNVTVSADASEYKPGQKGTLKVQVTEKNGEPFTGSVVLSMYDKSVEYISGGSNVEDIRKYFWQWRRSHNVMQQTSLEKPTGQVMKSGEVGMSYLGAFGYMAADGVEVFFAEMPGGVGSRYRSVTAGGAIGGFGGGGGGRGGRGGGREMDMSMSMAAPAMAPMSEAKKSSGAEMADAAPGQAGADVQPSVRTNFADTAVWAPALVAATNGMATVDVTMPESLTTWKARVWTFGNGSRVGEGTTEVVTRKNLIVRLEAPRFFVEKDEVVLSAIVHNYLKTKKSVLVELKAPTAQFAMATEEASKSSKSDLLWVSRRVDIEPQQEARVDWRMKVVGEGSAKIEMSAVTDEESDATAMTFPVYVHGMLKTESYAGALRPNPLDATARVYGEMRMMVPKERRPEQTRLEVRYSPTLAGAMVDALPYLVDFPYGCTEQTLNKFVPTVVTQKVLLDMKLDLADIQKKRTNLNAQEIGDPAVRAAQWKRFERNPVFDVNEVKTMVADGVMHLTAQQLSDGGWGWFSGYGEQSWPHTTAVVVHGLQLARDNGAALDAGVIERGVQWLANYQKTRLAFINAKREERKAGDMDAFVYMVLVDAGQDSRAMREIIYTDRDQLQVYTKAMFGLAMHKVNDGEKLKMILDNCHQYLVQDDENQTAYLKLPAGYWWYWYGSEYEAQGYYLKLLARTEPKGQDASRLAKYIINNRKNATYWNSTRDTAICVEALADYLRGSGETAPDMTVKVALDGKVVKTERITKENLFTFDNVFVMPGLELADGAHVVEVSREGTGPLYYNGYLTNFTLEDHITKAGLEVKVERKVYRLTRDDKKVLSEGERGQAVDKKVEKYVRTELSEGQTLKSGELVEIELKVDSKNDYEYILIEDMKAAGFEPVEVRSGYNGNEMGAYVEFRDERVAFFVRMLGRGEHSVSYRLRAEVPGSFSALPTRVSGMYAPELNGNSEEIRLRIVEGTK